MKMTTGKSSSSVTQFSSCFAVILIGLLFLISTMMVSEVDGFQVAVARVVGPTTTATTMTTTNNANAAKTASSKVSRRYILCHSSSPTDSSNDEVKSEETQATSTPPTPKPAVKCPDCDLCDGSGRYVLI